MEVCHNLTTELTFVWKIKNCVWQNRGFFNENLSSREAFHWTISDNCEKFHLERSLLIFLPNASATDFGLSLRSFVGEESSKDIFTWNQYMLDLTILGIYEQWKWPLTLFGRDFHTWNWWKIGWNPVFVFRNFRFFFNLNYDPKISDFKAQIQDWRLIRRPRSSLELLFQRALCLVQKSSCCRRAISITQTWSLFRWFPACFQLNHVVRNCGLVSKKSYHAVLSKTKDIRNSWYPSFHESFIFPHLESF